MWTSISLREWNSSSRLALRLSSSRLNVTRLNLKQRVHEVPDHQVRPYHRPWGLMKVLHKLPWARGMHYKLTWWYPQGRLKQTQLLVGVLHRQWLRPVYDHCHQQPRQQIWRHQVRHQCRAECHRGFHLPAQRCTKIMVLLFWHCTQSRRHASVVNIRRNEGL